MTKLGPLLCLLALALAQVPLLACASDCQDVLVSTAGRHDCHKKERHGLASALAHQDAHRHQDTPRHAAPSRRGGCCGHAHGSTQRPTQRPADCPEQPVGEREAPPEEPAHGLHQVIHVSVVNAGARLVLPEHAYAGEAPPGAALPGAALVAVLGTDAGPPAQAALEAAHRALQDPVPVPPPASVRLLL